MYRGLGLPALVRVVDPEQVSFQENNPNLERYLTRTFQEVKLGIIVYSRRDKPLTEVQVVWFCLTWRLLNRSTVITLINMLFQDLCLC